MPEILRYKPIASRQSLEEEKVQGVGAIVLIVNRHGQVYVIDEVEKKSGLGPPAEKRKKGEFMAENARAALLEEVGVSPDDFEDFKYLPGGSYLGRVLSSLDNGDLIFADVVLLYYSGNKEIFRSRNEVRGFGFVNPSLLVKYSDLRKAIRPALELILENRTIDDFISLVKLRGKPVFDNIDAATFDPDAFITKRAERPDLYVTQQTTHFY